MRLALTAWHAANKARAAETKRAYRAANLKVIRMRERDKHARRKGALGRFTEEHVRILFEDQEARCLYCGADLSGGFHVDHVVPLSRGGSNWPCNLALACSRCNLAKGSLTAQEFIDRVDPIAA